MIDLTNITYIKGLPGLFKFISRNKKGIVVESLTDKSRRTVYLNENRLLITFLTDIKIYTNGDDMPLEVVMTAVHEKYSFLYPPPDYVAPDSPDEITEFFLLAVPTYDQQRVYVSDIRRLLKWYLHLKETGNLRVKIEASIGQNEGINELNNEASTSSAQGAKVEAEVKPGVTPVAEALEAPADPELAATIGPDKATLTETQILRPETP